MKQLLMGVLILGLIGLGVVGGCGLSGYHFVKDFLNNRLNLTSGEVKAFRWCFNGLPLVDQLDRVLNHQTYLVLLQNSYELRPTGGFMGSYAQIKLESTGLAGFTVQDIYVPDGQIPGHVDPPTPIQQAFGQGWWKLRDANWDPDFTVAAQQIAWFFDQGGESTNGIIALNLSLVHSVLEALGEVKPSDYPEKVSAQTFYDLAQRYAEVGFFPGSTQKRDFLGAVGAALVGRVKQASPIEQVKLLQLVFNQLKQGEILIWFKDPQLQHVMAQRKWDGSLGDYSDDYLYIVETNLGANKANCCVIREVLQEITSQNTKLTINYKNNNPFANPTPPTSWGGNYINYLRVIVPVSSEIKSVKVGDRDLVEKALDSQYGLQADRYQIETRDKFKIIGFWAVIPAQQQVVVEVIYSNVGSKGLVLHHQPGMPATPYKLFKNGKLIIDKAVEREEHFSF